MTEHHYQDRSSIFKAFRKLIVTYSVAFTYFIIKNVIERSRYLLKTPATMAADAPENNLTLYAV